jgi:hypothetical protein
VWVDILGGIESPIYIAELYDARCLLTMKSSAMQTGKHREQHRDTAIDAKNVLLIKPLIISCGVLSVPATSMTLPTHRHPPST